MRIAFIGGGNMGEAMIKSLLAKGIARAEDIAASDISESRRQTLSKNYGIAVYKDNRQAVTMAEVIVLAIKPADLAKVLEEMKNQLSGQLVMSIVAGTDLNTLCQGLNYSSVVRVMPNLPAEIGEGISMWTSTPQVSEKQKGLAQSVLKAIGREIYASDEKYLDMATALSGSGPAFIFLILEALIDAGVHIGLPRDMAEELTLQTVLGSTKLVKQSRKHPAELRNRVTSPGGTTSEGLLQLEKGGLRSLIIQAVTTAYKKAQNLKAGR